jgi:hypothetical protein
MSLQTVPSHTSRPALALLNLPLEIRSLIYSQLVDTPPRLRALCPLSRSAPREQPSLSSLLETCRQVRHEASPIIYRAVYFGWLSNMTKVLASPVRTSFYSQYILEATLQYDIGLIQDGLKAALRLSRLQRFILLAEVSAIRTEDRHINGNFKTLRLFRDDLGDTQFPMPFQVELRLSIVDLEAKIQRGRPFASRPHGDKVEQPAGMVSKLHSF